MSMDKIRKCKDCGVILTNDNWSESSKKHRTNQCKECSRKYQRDWHRNNREKLHKNYKNSRRQLKLEVLSHYSNGKLECACCGETIYEFLTIDHINGGGLKHRRELKPEGGSISGPKFYAWLKRNGFPEGFQVLCMNCNWGRSLNNGICPHKKVVP